MADIDWGINPENFKWHPPTENVDGTPVKGPLSYNVYRGDTDVVKDVGSLFYTVVGALQPDGHYEAPIVDFPEGGHVIAMTAVDVDGDESDLSQTASFRVGIAPNPPMLLA